jgi:phosphoadenosine phosphosulfate reductase
MPDLFGNTSEEEIYQQAINQPLDHKIQLAIDNIRNYEPMAIQLCEEEGYYLAFSGGKDSIVMEKLFEMSGVKYQSYYNNVTIDPPELVRFIKRKYSEVKWNNPGKHLTSKMVDKSNGPPTRIARWCCELYKEQGGAGKFKCIGVRAEESARRKGLWTTITMHNKDNTPILCPIIYWTENDIWNFIRQNNMEYCELYDQGFDRLGCIGCPLGGPKNQRKEFERWPKYEKLWKRGFQMYWDRWKGVPRRDGGDRWIERLNSVDELWEWWISGGALHGKDSDCQMWLW